MTGINYKRIAGNLSAGLVVALFTASIFSWAGAQDKIPASTNQLNALSSSVDASLTEQAKQIKELERKVAGMQKQITALHAKKLNADDYAHQRQLDGMGNSRDHNTLVEIIHGEQRKLTAAEARIEETREQTANCLKMVKSRHADFVKWAEGVDKKLNNR